MQSRYTVYRVTCNDGKVCHFDLSVMNDRHFVFFILISRIFLFYFQKESVVDLLNDLINTRKQTGEDFNRPFFQCFCHDGMVGVCTGLCCDRPCLIPGQTFLIQKDSHQLCNCYGWVCIVHLDGYFLRKFVDIRMIFFITGYGTLYTGRYEEILLFQTQLFTLDMVVVRIENFYQVSCKIFLLNGFSVITFVKGIQLKTFHRLSIPNHQRVYHIVVVSNDRHIIRNSQYGLIIFLNEFCPSVLSRLSLYITTEFDFKRMLRSAQLKRITVFQPVIRYFHLITVFDLLFEHTVTITDTTSVSSVTKRSKGIHKTCSKTAQTTVSECRIRLLVFDHIQIKSDFIQCFFYFLVCGQIDQVVTEGTTHQKLHRHVIYHLRIFFVERLLGSKPVVNDNIFYSIRHRLEDFLFGSLLHGFAVKCFHIVFYTFNEFFFVK